MNKTIKMIDNVNFDKRLDLDMMATEIEAIKQRNIEKLGRLDTIDLMYDAYKLGFAKGLEEARKELK